MLRRCPSVRNDAGQPLWRFDLLWQLLLLPDKWLLPNWFGTPPEFSLLDRLPVLLVAGAILAWATVLGWLLCFVCRGGGGVSGTSASLHRRAPPHCNGGLWLLTRLEVFVFSVAVGLNAAEHVGALDGASGGDGPAGDVRRAGRADSGAGRLSLATQSRTIRPDKCRG